MGREWQTLVKLNQTSRAKTERQKETQKHRKTGCSRPPFTLPCFLLRSGIWRLTAACFLLPPKPAVAVCLPAPTQSPVCGHRHPCTSAPETEVPSWSHKFSSLGALLSPVLLLPTLNLMCPVKVSVRAPRLNAVFLACTMCLVSPFNVSHELLQQHLPTLSQSLKSAL